MSVTRKGEARPPANTCYNYPPYLSRTALHCASYGGFADTMSLLLEAQANPNLQDNEVSETSFHWSVRIMD